MERKRHGFNQGRGAFTEAIHPELQRLSGKILPVSVDISLAFIVAIP